LRWDAREKCCFFSSLELSSARRFVLVLLPVLTFKRSITLDIGYQEGRRWFRASAATSKVIRHGKDETPVNSAMLGRTAPVVSALRRVSRRGEGQNRQTLHRSG
jgi:hypothetical protein